MVTTIKNIVIDLIPDLWPIIIIITVISCSLRIAYLIKNKIKFCFYKELFTLLFIIYVMCLFEIVTLQDTNYGTSNIIPFKEIFRYTLGSRLFVKNIIGNILLFLPYGYFASYYLKSKKAIPICILSLIVSLTIEIVQLNIGRTFDIDDVILNTVSGFLGYLIYSLIYSFSDKLPSVLKNDDFINLIVVLVIIVVIIYMVNYNILNWLS